MATATQRKRKAAQRRHHARKVKAVAESARPTVAAFVKEELGVDLQPYQEAVVKRMFSDIPKRAKCPVCSTSQKVKRDGTMGRHDVVRNAGISEAHQCAGTGKRWDSG